MGFCIYATHAPTDMAYVTKFYNNMVKKKEMLEYRSVWQKMTSSRDHRYNTADPSTDHKEGASLIKYNQPCLIKLRSIKRKDKGNQI